ncbi:MAG: hypothetical protein BGO90_14230 [Legionella sp. 40-6]|nr:diguanylate cyclase [Legionella sp.]OJY49553.1 MAG: hypothetical protein BGO90_14230 [Legionella sp. 40-6]
MSDNLTSLKEEITRLKKIIQALMDKAEQDMNAPRTDFSVFQNTVILADQVRKRTQELEDALKTNEKIARDLQQAKKLVEQSEQYLRDISSALGEGIIVINEHSRIEFVNASACTLLGYQEEEIIGKKSHPLFHHSYPDNSPFPAEECKNLQVIRTQKPYVSEEDFFWRKDGSCFPVSLITTPIKLKGNIIGAITAFHDITQFVYERERLREMQAAIEQSPVSVVIIDRDKKIIYVNPQIIQLTGYSREELQGQKIDIFYKNVTSKSTLLNLWRTINSGTPWVGDLLYKRKDGSTFWQSWNIAPVFAVSGLIQHFVGVGEDITEKKKLQFLLQEISYIDGLTGVANRRRFDQFLDETWRRAFKRKKNIAIIMIDIDYFKRYNDYYGHLAGDEALKKVAKILKSTFVYANGLVARYGGEEFTCILPDVTLDVATTVAEKLRQAVLDLKIPHEDSGISPYVTISLGVAAMVPQSSLPNSLLSMADNALYHAKVSGRNCVQIGS